MTRPYNARCHYRTRLLKKSSSFARGPILHNRMTPQTLYNAENNPVCIETDVMFPVDLSVRPTVDFFNSLERF